MQLTVRDQLKKAVQDVVKEFDRCEERVKKAEEIRDNQKATTHRLVQRIKEMVQRIKQLEDRCEFLQAELDKARPEICSTFKVHLSDESEKIAELSKEVADLRKENRELCEQLKNKSILDTVCFQKYWKQQNALDSCERGEACEVELNTGGPFEKGYFLRLTKKQYELCQDDRLSTHVAYMKRSDK